MLGKAYRWCPKGCGKKVSYYSGNVSHKFKCAKCGKKWETLLHFENSWKIKLDSTK